MTDKQKEQVSTLKNMVKECVSGDTTDSKVELETKLIYSKTLLFLNRSELPELAIPMIVDVITKNLESESESKEAFVSSVSDNGQTVSFSNEARNTFATSEDKALFGGHYEILKNMRRVSVV